MSGFGDYSLSTSDADAADMAEQGDIHIFSRHGVFSVVDGRRELSSGWYPVVYGNAGKVFPDRKVHLWFCGEGSSEQLSDFNLEGEPIHHLLPGYHTAVKDFANSALWGCLREQVPNVPDEMVRRGFKEFYEFSLKTAEKIIDEVPQDATLIFQDYQFVLLPGILNGTIDRDQIEEAFGSSVLPEEIDLLVHRTQEVQRAFADRNNRMSSFLHTSLPKPEYWNQLPGGVGSMVIRSLVSDHIGVHSPNWEQRLFDAHVQFGGDSEGRSRIFASPIGMNAISIHDTLSSDKAAAIKERVQEDDLGDKLVLISGRADPKNAISSVLQEISKSYDRDPEIWDGYTLVLQVPPDGKEGCAEEFEKIQELVSKLMDQGFPKVKWYNDNNRERSIVLAEKAKVFVSGTLLGGFEVVTLEALFANKDIDVICSSGIGSAYVLDGLATRFDTHAELQDKFVESLTRESNGRPKHEIDFIDELGVGLSPDSWLHHVVARAEQHQTGPIVERLSFLERCFANSGLPAAAPVQQF